MDEDRVMLKKVKAENTLLPTRRALDKEGGVELAKSYEALMGRALSESELEDIDNIADVCNCRHDVNTSYPMGRSVWKKTDVTKTHKRKMPDGSFEPYVTVASIKRVTMHPFEFARLCNIYPQVFRHMEAMRAKLKRMQADIALGQLLEWIGNRDLDEEDLKTVAYTADVMARINETFVKQPAINVNINQTQNNNISETTKTLFGLFDTAPALVRQLAPRIEKFVRDASEEPPVDAVTKEDNG